MSAHHRIHVRPDGALVAGRHVLARIPPGDALALAVELVTAAVRAEALGEAENNETNPGDDTADRGERSMENENHG